MTRMTRPPVGPAGYTLLTAATVSRLADNTAPVAIVLLVIARTHDARLAGLLVAAFTVPTLIAGPVLGAYLDRLQRRRLLFTASQLVLTLDLAAVLALTGRVPGWLLAVLAVAAVRGDAEAEVGAYAIRVQAKRLSVGHNRTVQIPVYEEFVAEVNMRPCTF